MHDSELVTLSPSEFAALDTRGRPPRVVLETSVVVTALMFGGGLAAGLRSAWQTGRCRPMVCKATLLDLRASLAHPHLDLAAHEQEQMLHEYLPHVLKVRVPQADQLSADDLPAMAFVRLAMAGQAHALVSGDPQLLALGERFTCPIVALNGFMDMMVSADITPQPLRPRLASGWR